MMPILMRLVWLGKSYKGLNVFDFIDVGTFGTHFLFAFFGIGIIGLVLGHTMYITFGMILGAVTTNGYVGGFRSPITISAVAGIFFGGLFISIIGFIL